MKLVVTHPFAQYTRGQDVTDADAIKAALESHPEKVVRVATPAPPDGTKES